MRSNNGNHTMKLNRFIAKPAVIPLLVLGFDLFMFFCFNYAINSIRNIVPFIQDKDNPYKYFGLKNVLPNFTDSAVLIYVYIAAGLFLLVLNARMIYQIWANFSEGDLNYGQEGTSRWTTLPEVMQQYKKIPEKDTFYKGKGGTIVTRYGKYLYVDDAITNNLIIGTTRSGKGEMYVFPSIGVYSRAQRMEDRPSMVIADPKLELYKSSKKTLEERGYEVRLFNLDDPLKSMGYNPLQLVVDNYKDGRPERAQMSAKTFAFGIFNAGDSAQEAIWKNTATDLFTALIIAIVTDCLDADKELNKKRKKAYIAKRDSFDQLGVEEKDAARQRYQEYEVAAKGEDLILKNVISYIPDGVIYEDIYVNERNINCFSVINFFKELCDRAALVAEDEEDFEKKADSALDNYFNARPKLDFAAGLYNEIKNAGERTKGSVYINMQSAVSTFNLQNIAQMTAENDVDIRSLGYSDKPIAIFMGIPSEDRSNHFLATTFIAQIYQYLFQVSKTTKGRLKRDLKFILDEFGNLPPIENFSGFVTVCLGLGISFDIYVQSYNQIHSKYGDDSKTILENFANQIYIMSVGNESAEEFSDMLGNRTAVEVQRSGKRMEFDKNITETTKKQPLMYPNDLTVLRPGECVIFRGTKRTDKFGVSVRSYPIICEYVDYITLSNRVRIVVDIMRKRYIKGVRLKRPDDPDRYTTLGQEIHIRLGKAKRDLGTALKYRYEYLIDAFPNPNDVEFDDICDESRAHIDYINRVVNPDEVLAFLADKQRVDARKERTAHMAQFTGSSGFRDADCYELVKEMITRHLGRDVWESFGLEHDSFGSAFEKISALEGLPMHEKQSLLAQMRKEKV